MAFAANSQILPVGITGGSPFAVGDGVFVSLTQPPTVISTPSLRLNTGTPDQIEIGPSTTPHATVIGFGAVVPAGGNGNQVVIGTSATSGTDTQDDVVIGHSANAGVTNGGIGSVAIGVSAAVGGVGSNAGGGVAVGNGAQANNGVAIGQGATCLTGQVAIGLSSLAQAFGVAIGGGANAFVGGAHGNGSVAIGRNASAGESTDIVVATGGSGTASGGGGNIYIGGGIGGSGVQGHDSVVIGGSSNTGGVSGTPASATAAGVFSTVIGGNSQARHSGARILGRGLVSTAANQTLIGGLDDPAATVVLGNGAVAAAPQNVILGVTGGDASANNIPGASLTIAGGISTGTAVGGSIVFQTTPAGGASNTTPNALTTALTIDSTQTVTFAKAPQITATVATGATALTLTNGPATAIAGPPQAYGAFLFGGVRYVMPLWTA